MNITNPISVVPWSALWPPNPLMWDLNSLYVVALNKAPVGLNLADPGMKTSLQKYTHISTIAIIFHEQLSLNYEE